MRSPIPNVVNVEISSYRGVSLGAEHYYASLSFYDADGEYKIKELRHRLTAKQAKALNKKDGVSGCYKPGNMTERFDTAEDIQQIAIETFKELVPHAIVLTCGRSAVVAPQLVLVGPKGYKAKVNKLAERYKELDWDTDGKELQAICDEFDALNNKYGVI